VSTCHVVIELSDKIVHYQVKECTVVKQSCILSDMEHDDLHQPYLPNTLGGQGGRGVTLDLLLLNQRTEVIKSYV